MSSARTHATPTPRQAAAAPSAAAVGTSSATAPPAAAASAAAASAAAAPHPPPQQQQSTTSSASAAALAAAASARARAAAAAAAAAPPPGAPLSAVAAGPVGGVAAAGVVAADPPAAAAALRDAVAESKHTRMRIEARGDHTRQLQAALQTALDQITKIEHEFARFKAAAEHDRAHYAAVLEHNALLRAQIARLTGAAGPPQPPTPPTTAITPQPLVVAPLTHPIGGAPLPGSSLSAPMQQQHHHHQQQQHPPLKQQQHHHHHHHHQHTMHNTPPPQPPHADRHTAPSSRTSPHKENNSLTNNSIGANRREISGGNGNKPGTTATPKATATGPGVRASARVAPPVAAPSAPRAATIDVPKSKNAPSRFALAAAMSVGAHHTNSSNSATPSSNPAPPDQPASASPRPFERALSVRLLHSDRGSSRHANNNNAPRTLTVDRGGLAPVRRALSATLRTEQPGSSNSSAKSRSENNQHQTRTGKPLGSGASDQSAAQQSHGDGSTSLPISERPEQYPLQHRQPLQGKLSSVRGNEQDNAPALQQPAQRPVSFIRRQSARMSSSTAATSVTGETGTETDRGDSFSVPFGRKSRLSRRWSTCFQGPSLRPSITEKQVS